MNFWPLGILKLWFSPFSNVKITVVGGVTCHTFPVTVSTVVITFGVVLMMVCFSTFIPTLALWMLTGFPSTITVVLSGTLSKCLNEPSSILMTTLFPLMYTISPRSTFTSFAVGPCASVFCVCTCAVAERESARQITLPPSRPLKSCFDRIIDIILSSPCFWCSCPW